MNGKYFIDTNIFVYTFDNSDSEKQKLSQQIVAHALEKSTGVISYQVIQEFLNVSTKKFKSPFNPGGLSTIFKRCSGTSL